jgi:hypothetical protein
MRNEMSYPQIYLGKTPESPHERRALRARALDLRARLRNLRDPMPLLVLLNALHPGAAGVASLVLARPHTLIVASLRAWPQPIAVRSGEAWSDLQTGALLEETGGRTPFQHIAMLRDTLRDHVVHAMTPGGSELRVVERAIGAVICMPALHPESQIHLDVDDHRNRLKVLGLDELAGLASMSGATVQLSESSLHTLLRDMLGGRLWHDGNRLLFELVPPRYELELLDGTGSTRWAMALIEGENVIGRRRTARPHEYRITISADDLVSSDHAVITCHDDGHVTLRDVSKNGTWIRPPGLAEQYVHGAEQPLTPGTQLRMGVTQLQLSAVARGEPGA